MSDLCIRTGCPLVQQQKPPIEISTLHQILLREVKTAQELAQDTDDLNRTLVRCS